MIGLSLTLDYEVYGDGTGSITDLVIDPTADFLDICERFGARGTLFVDVAEFMRMKEYKCFEEDLTAVEEQLKHAHERGHDVQLHIHPWWFNAKFLDGKWQMNYTVSTLSHLDSIEASNYVNSCKQYLSVLLKGSENDYKCVAFRAGAWCMMPTKTIYHVLIAAGIKIDSSVYKWGKMDAENAKYDYSNAYSNIHPWVFDPEDVNEVDGSKGEHPKCLEVPIYTEHQRMISFITWKRVKLMRKVKSVLADNPRSGDTMSRKMDWLNKIKLLTKKRAKKLDFCKCTFRELKKMIQNVVKYHTNHTKDDYLPVVAIGHSKDFIYQQDLIDLLRFIKSDYPDLIEVVPLTYAVNKYDEGLMSIG